MWSRPLSADCGPLIAKNTLFLVHLATISINGCTTVRRSSIHLQNVNNLQAIIRNHTYFCWSLGSVEIGVFNFSSYSFSACLNSSTNITSQPSCSSFSSALNNLLLILFKFPARRLPSPACFLDSSIFSGLAFAQSASACAFQGLAKLTPVIWWRRMVKGFLAPESFMDISRLLVY